MPRNFDTEGTPFLFAPHSEGELDEYFSANHERSIATAGKDLSKSNPEIAHKREYFFLKSCTLRCSVRIADKVSCIRKDRIG